MTMTILITGSTDGIGLETAKMLAQSGHHILLHGRNQDKLAASEKHLSGLPGVTAIEIYIADLSHMTDVEALAAAVSNKHAKLDVLINNAGVFGAPNTQTSDGLDLRFAVNAIAPYLLTKKLLPLLGASGRVINLSSAAQSPVDLNALAGNAHLSDGAAYAQSKLALTMWSRGLAQTTASDGPVIVAVNPGSMLGTKMVKDAYGVTGKDIGIGADILSRAAVSGEFAGASGQYFDNDVGRFGPPHPDALDAQKCDEVVCTIETISKMIVNQSVS